MFSIPEPDLGYGDAIKVFVRKNGTNGPLREVRLPSNSKLCDLFEKAAKALDLDLPQRAFYSNGIECTDIDHIEEDEVLMVSCGEDFAASEGIEGSEVIGNYILHEKLGQGGFGSVLKGVHAETGEAAAIKFVPKNTFRQFSDLQRVFMEIQALRNLRHPNVIRILDVADHPENICFIMEFASGGELRGYVERHASLGEEEARIFFKQIVRAVHYIHSKKIIHRDLKLENILLDSSKRCKIVDFGLSDYVSSKERTVTDAGTEAYLAPEAYSGSSRDSDPFKIDVWSLGVILYAMTHGKLPFARPDAETCAKLESEGLQLKDELSTGSKRLIKAMLTPRPEKRPTVGDVSLDTWVTKHRFANWDGLPGLGGAGSDSCSEPAEAIEAESEGEASNGAERVPSSPAAKELAAERLHSGRERPVRRAQHLMPVSPRDSGKGREFGRQPSARDRERYGHGSGTAARAQQRSAASSAAKRSGVSPSPNPTGRGARS